MHRNWIISTVFLVLLPGIAVGENPATTQAADVLQEFNVKDCTGPAAGKTLCYYCRYGQRPVVCVFASEVDDATAKLIAGIDALLAQRKDERWAAFFVLLADDTRSNEKRLKDLAERHKIIHTPLTIYRDTPEKLRDNLRVSSESTVTVRWWNEGVMVGEQRAIEPLDDQQIQRIIHDLSPRDVP